MQGICNILLTRFRLILGRYGISWGAIGALEDCIERTRAYALERHQFNRPLASFQLVQKKLADAHVEANLALLASYQVLCVPRLTEVNHTFLIRSGD